MNNRALEITVGLFVLAGILAFALLAFKVSGLTLSNSNTGTYKVTAYFDSVEGLKLRSRISFAGVTIGKVTGIKIDPKKYQAKVTMEIDNSANFLPDDSTALIYTAGLLGEKYIGFSLGGDEKVLKDGSVIKDTQSSLVLEDLINKFIMGSDDSGKDMVKQLSTLNDTLKDLVDDKVGVIKESSNNKVKTFQVKAYFDNVDGLKLNSKVSTSGVTIGKVTGIKYSPTRYQAEVTMELNDSANYIPADSTAIVYSSGPNGGKYIGLILGGDEEVLKDGSVIKDTQSSLVLEDLISKFIMGSDGSDKDVVKQLSILNDTLKDLIKKNPSVAH